MSNNKLIKCSHYSKFKTDTISALKKKLIDIS